MNKELLNCERVWLNVTPATLRPDLADYGLLEPHALGVRDGKIHALVPMQDLKGPYAASWQDMKGKLVTPVSSIATPTSSSPAAAPKSSSCARRECPLCGDRPQGGGIISTVRATRAASEERLYELALPRIKSLIREGVTTVEIKSGYGLTLEDELKMLRVARRLGRDAAHPGQDHAAGGPCGAAGVSRRSRLLGRDHLPGDHPGGGRGRSRGCGGCLLRTHRLLPCPDRAGLSGGGSVQPRGERAHGSALQPGGQHARRPLRRPLGGSSGISGSGWDPGVGPPWRGRHPAAHRFLFPQGDQAAPDRRLAQGGVPMAVSSDINPGTAPSSPCAWP